MGGLILFGRDRLTRVPDAWIQAGCFAGKDSPTLADRAELREYPVRAIEDARLRAVGANEYVHEYEYEHVNDHS